MTGRVVARLELIRGVEAIEQVAFLGGGFECLVVGGSGEDSGTGSSGYACHYGSRSGGDSRGGDGGASDDGGSGLHGSLEETRCGGLHLGVGSRAALEVAAGGGGLLHAGDVAVRGFVVLVHGSFEERCVVLRVDDSEFPHLLHGKIVAGRVDIELPVDGLPRVAPFGEDALLRRRLLLGSGLDAGYDIRSGSGRADGTAAGGEGSSIGTADETSNSVSGTLAVGSNAGASSSRRTAEAGSKLI